MKLLVNLNSLKQELKKIDFKNDLVEKAVLAKNDLVLVTKKGDQITIADSKVITYEPFVKQQERNWGKIYSSIKDNEVDQDVILEIKELTLNITFQC